MGAEMELTVTVAAGSSTVPVTVVGLRFRKLRLAGAVNATVGTGAYVKLSVDVLVFPATSVAITLVEFEPVTSVIPQLKVLPFTLAGTPLQVTVASPERASATVPVTV